MGKRVKKYTKLDSTKKESNIALLMHLIKHLDDETTKMTSGQIRKYLLDAVNI